MDGGYEVTTTQKPMKKPIDLNEWSYIMIKDMILRNKIAAGEQIRIENLINMLQVSRTPIREALIRLHNDGLVDVFPHVGYYVRGFSRSEYHDVFELRLLIECHTAEIAAATMTDEQIRKLKIVNERGEIAIEDNDEEAMNKYEIEFHNTLIAHSGNQQIIKVMANISDYISRGRMIALRSRENIMLSFQEHLKVIHAIEQHSPEKAKRAMAEHIRRVEDRLSTLIEFVDEKKA